MATDKTCGLINWRIVGRIYLMRQFSLQQFRHALFSPLASLGMRLELLSRQDQKYVHDYENYKKILARLELLFLYDKKINGEYTGEILTDEELLKLVEEQLAK